MAISGLYVHIPFCTRRCGYCDFNTFAGQSHLIPRYVDALCQELEWVAKDSPEYTAIDTIFFGGGTPSLLSSEQFRRIHEQMRRSFSLVPEAEITLEANPGTVTSASISELHDLGFNRVSFGMQSAHPQDLAILDRQHRFTDAANAVAWSRKAGFQHINVDLIFGIPGQPLKRWQDNLELAVQMGVDHLSLYSLILEEGTQLQRWYQRGLLDLVDDDLVADMFEYAMDYLPTAGFEQYEISNWARGLDARCKHNLNTWHYQPYFGIGAGAHGFIGDVRTANVNLIPAYIGRMKKPAGEWPAAETVERLEKWEEMQEWMMVGLRLVSEGVSKLEFKKHFGYALEQVFPKQLERLTRQGLLEECGELNDHIHLTRRGVMLGNWVFSEFVGNEKPEFVENDQPDFI
jgi:oxygen-independent coproporphyrinogen-3 oxidase